MTEQRPNFYRLLGLDPYATWDQARFQRLLTEKQKQWTRESMGIETSALNAQQYLQLIPEITRVMKDEVLRAKEVQRAKAEQGEQYQHRSIEFEQALHDLEAKGYVEEQEVAQLVIAFQDVLSEDEINQQINVPVYSLEVHDTEDSETLETAVLRDIDEKLALLGLTNLYQLLDLPFTASSQTVCSAAERMFDEMQRRQPKTAEVVAQVSLAGHARTIFSNEQKRQQFDAYVQQQTVQMLLRGLDGRMRGHHELPTRQATDFLDAAYEAGYTNDQALDILQQHMQAQGWSFERVTKENHQVTLYVPPAETLRDLVVQNIGRALRLSWIWSADCSETRVSVSSEGWPDTSNVSERTFQVTRAEYEASGHYDLQMPPNQHYYIVVEAITRRSGSPIITGSIRGEGNLIPQISISYEIKNPRPGFRYRTLHLYPKKPVQLFATLLLICKRHGQPLHKLDGELFHREAEPINMPATTHIISLPERDFPPDTYAKLFLEDDNLYSAIHLFHPKERRLKLK